MTDRPIFMSAPMMRAILDGTKTQTRRPVTGFALDWLTMQNGFNAKFVALQENHLCRYGYAGDQLWVKETFYAWGRWETRFSEKKGRDEWHFIDMTLEAGKAYAYTAVGLPAGFAKKHGAGRGGVMPTWWKRPAIFMPRAASRITLEVTGVRVERLQDISEADAAAEGWPGPDADNSIQSAYPIAWYSQLWESINGPGSWDANPWVWCVSFRRVAP